MFFALWLKVTKTRSFLRWRDEDLWLMQKTRASIPSLVSTLKECIRKRDFEAGKKLHAECIESGEELNPLIANALITMYSKCGSLPEAEKIFEKLSASRTTASWNSLMLGYTEVGKANLALGLFSSMLELQHVPDARSLTAALKACTALASLEKGVLIDGKPVKIKSLSQGMKLHYEALKAGVEFEIPLTSCLIEMYAGCGSMPDARRVFHRAPLHTAFLWNALMLGYLESGEEEVALSLFERMQPSPDDFSFATALKAFNNLALKQDTRTALERGLMIQVRAIASSCVSETMISNTLLGIYGRCRSMEQASVVFDRIRHRNVASWNALISGYVSGGECEAALEIFHRMYQKSGGVFPDSRTYVAALKACSRLAVKEESTMVDGKLLKLRALQTGLEVHTSVLNSDCGSNSFVTNTLLDMYSKCGSMVDARRIFDEMRSRDVVSWSVLIRGYAVNGDPGAALEIFRRMQLSGYVPDARSFLAALMGCIGLAETSQQGAKARAMQQGMAIHSLLLNSGIELNSFLASALVDLYVNYGKLSEARKVFDELRFQDVVVRTSLILGYAEAGLEEEALELFFRMKIEGCSPDARAVLGALKASTGLAAKERTLGGSFIKVQALEKGRIIHSEALSQRGAMDRFVANGLLDMYMKCGSLRDVERVFDRLPCHDLASSTTMILAYSESGEKERAWEMFQLLRARATRDCHRHHHQQLDNRMLAAALMSCSDAAVLNRGKSVHAEVLRFSLENDPVLQTCLLDMYSKCGSLDDAQRLFDSLGASDFMSCNSLLAGYSRQGAILSMFDTFHRMIEEGLKPNGVTFLSLLTGCSHAGLIERGTRYFNSMGVKYGVEARVEHYHCVIDMLGRGNRLDSAMQLVNSMPFKPNAVTWRTLLGSCHKWNNVVVGKFAYDALMELGEPDAAPYNLMGNIYGR